jgi:hypothetical protein
MRVLVAGVLVALGACSSILDVKNPNDVAESALDNPSAAGPMANGVLASTVRMLAGITTPYSEGTDELDWIGSRDAWNQLDKGVISDPVNEFTDGAFPYVGEARYLGDMVIGRLEGFDANAQLNDRTILARAYLYTAIVYTSIADMYDDFAFSSKTVNKAPVGRANMGTLYDKAVSYLDKAQTIANTGTDNVLKYNIVAYRARVKHAKGVWAKIPKGAVNIAAPLVSDAGSIADANAAIALGATDQKFTLFCNVEACTSLINIWFEVNGRNESTPGSVYKNLIDPVSGVKDPTTAALLTQFTAFGTQSGTFTLTSNRELRLILAEAALSAGNVAEFTNQLNQVRALDGKPAWAGTPAAQTMLAYERQAQLWLMRRRLSDMYRFNQKDAVKWASDPNYESAFSTGGLLFPIPNTEILANPCIKTPTGPGC